MLLTAPGASASSVAYYYVGNQVLARRSTVVGGIRSGRCRGSRYYDSAAASWVEGYYDDVQSLGVKWDMVNQRGLAGTGMWALLMDEGSPDLWNLLAAKFVNVPPTFTETYNPPRTLFFEPGTYVGRQFNASGAVTASLSYTLATASNAPTSQRSTIPNQPGTWYYITAGIWAGYWIQESAGVTLGATAAGHLRARSTPSRLLDTRVGNGLAGPFVANTPRTFQVAGRGGVPASAVAVTGNLAVTNQSGAGCVPTSAPTAVEQPDQLDPELPDRRHPGDRGDGGPRPGRQPERDRRLCRLGRPHLRRDRLLRARRLAARPTCPLDPLPTARHPGRQRPRRAVRGQHPAHLPGRRPGWGAGQRGGGHLQLGGSPARAAPASSSSAPLRCPIPPA